MTVIYQVKRENFKENVYIVTKKLFDVRKRKILDTMFNMHLMDI